MRSILSVAFIFLVSLNPASAAALKVGTPAPDFTLPSVDGKSVKLGDYKGKTVVLEWFNLGCPFSKKHYDAKNMQALQEESAAKGVIWLSINSTNPKHANHLPPEKARAQAAEQGFKSAAVLLDDDGRVGSAYGAKTTPHMFIINADGNIAYQGAIDDDPGLKADPRQAANYVRKALDELLAGKPVSQPETKQYGCSIKYAQ